MKAIVTGMIATYPVGGVAWDYGQYALGLERLGWEVYYLEDNGMESYNPVKGAYGNDSDFGVRFLEQTLSQLSPSLASRWHFRDSAGQTYGISEADCEELVAGADLFLNVSGGTLLRDAYMRCPCKVMIDSDPGWNHFVNFPRWDANPGWQGTHGFRAHDHFFTYAGRIGRSDCVLPDLGIRWHATRPPVVMDCWRGFPQATKWTTVMTWNNFREPVEYRGHQYGTKEMEFPKIEDLPSYLDGIAFELATGGSGAPVEHWRSLGWKVVDSHAVSTTLDRYRDYIQGSRGEFSVAKNLYSATRSGWFSCRSVCYLAAGRPCVVQDTGFSEHIATGKGLFAFRNLAEAIEAIQRIESDYDGHCDASREVAKKYFDSNIVLNEILNVIAI